MMITIDHRERASGIIDLLKQEAGVFVDVKNMAHGDYVINDSITVERKTAKDFLVSIIDGRLFNQLSNLKKYCTNPILLIEGNPYNESYHFDDNAIKGALISTQTIWYVPALFSKSKEDTKDIMLMIARQDETHMDVVPLRGGFRPKRLKSKQLYVLQGLPQVGPVMAKRLLLHFKSISKIITATLEELIQVEGMGKRKAKRIREILDTDFR